MKKLHKRNVQNLFFKLTVGLSFIWTLFACSPKVGNELMNGDKLPKIKDKELVDRLDSLSKIEPRTFYSKLDINYKDSTTDISFKTSLKIVADSAVSAIITYARIPIVTAMVTKDTITVVNKREKCYTVQSLDYLKTTFGVDFTYENMEELFFSQLDLLSETAEDAYAKDLRGRTSYLTQKYRLKKTWVEPVQFFQHRPDNFPTIRLAQLAMLYHLQQNLFAKIIAAASMNDLYELFNSGVSAYWENHYQLDKVSPAKKKRLSKSFIDLLVMNTIVPLQFAYAESLGKEISESLVQLLQTIPPEKNIVIEKFANFGITAESAFETQSLLQLKNNYCSKGRCLQCAVGVHLLKE